MNIDKLLEEMTDEQAYRKRCGQKSRRTENGCVCFFHPFYSRPLLPRIAVTIIYTFSHTGIVESVQGGVITAIEGNTSAGNDANEKIVQYAARQGESTTQFIVELIEKEMRSKK